MQNVIPCMIYRPIATLAASPKWDSIVYVGKPLDHLPQFDSIFMHGLASYRLFTAFPSGKGYFILLFHRYGIKTWHRAIVIFIFITMQ